MILVAGGALDPHNERILAALRRAGAPHHAVLCGPRLFPRIHYTVPGGALEIDGAPIAPTALWLRHDVFGALADRRPAVVQRAQAWFDALIGWASLRPDLRWPNRAALGRRINKVTQLALAHAHGLHIPTTWVTNDLSRLAPEAPGLVAKPISGGGHCMPMTALLTGIDPDGAAPQPAFVQARQAGPELRVYLVGERLFAWEIATTALDHRTDPAAGLRESALPADVAAPLRALARTLGLELAAADFKRDPTSGAPVFLEINTQPMWTAYDTASGGALADAMVRLLASSA